MIAVAGFDGETEKMMQGFRNAGQRPAQENKAGGALLQKQLPNGQELAQDRFLQTARQLFHQPRKAVVEGHQIVTVQSAANPP